MSRIATAIVCLSAFVVAADALPSSDAKLVNKSLDGIYTAAGISARERIRKCGIKVLPGASWVETSPQARPEYGAAAGDTILSVSLDIPLMKGEDPKTHKPAVALWIISHGAPAPVSAWAKTIQTRTIPLGYTAWMNC